MVCRYGKLIPYAESEQRMEDLLSSLCEAVDKAVLLTEVQYDSCSDGELDVFIYDDQHLLSGAAFLPPTIPLFNLYAFLLGR